MHFILFGHHTSLHICNHIYHKDLQHNFPKMRGGVEGRLEFFRKFIRFGSATLPLVSLSHHFSVTSFIIYSTARLANLNHVNSIWNNPLLEASIISVQGKRRRNDERLINFQQANNKPRCKGAPLPSFWDSWPCVSPEPPWTWKFSSIPMTPTSAHLKKSVDNSLFKSRSVFSISAESSAFKMEWRLSSIWRRKLYIVTCLFRKFNHCK